MPAQDEALGSTGRPVMRRLPALTIAQVVEQHGAGFARVRAAGDWSDREFRRGLGPLLLSFARYVHLLPGADADLPGAALDQGLAACAQALQCAEQDTRGGIVAGSAITPPPMAGIDRASTLRRQHVVALHALSSSLDQTLRHWEVFDGAGRTLDVTAQPLADWLSAQALNSYLAVPTAQGDAGGLGLTLLLRAAPAWLLANIARDEAGLLAWLLAAPSDYSTGPAARIGAGALPAPTLNPARAPAQQLRDAMETLVTSGRWAVNQKRARLWHLDGALYLVWKTAAVELAAVLADRASGIEAGERLQSTCAAESDALLRQLIASGIVVGAAMGGATRAGSALCTIATPFSDSLPVVRLADADHWLSRVPAIASATTTATTATRER